MYKDYWNLKEKPFETTPDPRFLYYSRDHEEALLRLFYTVRGSKGAMLLTGGYGCGKTVLSRVFLNELVSSKYSVALITNPRYSASELLEEITYQLSGNEKRLTSKVELLRAFNEVIYANMVRKKETVVIIDEAQAIDDVQTFEELRLLLNYQQNNKYLLNLILIGQPEIREKLAELPQFVQRLAIRYHLSNLNETDTVKYIEHRLRVAGATRPIFDYDVMSTIFQCSNGIPRVINSIADMALLSAFVEGKTIVDAAMIYKVMEQISMEVPWSGS
ncbi:MAG: AAA family ATPase [Candidatus Omnitrophica bacterium]|nr:AAA family ATPase [Candidatus Omnitrophota bacterium]